MHLRKPALLSSAHAGPGPASTPMGQKKGILGKPQRRPSEHGPEVPTSKPQANASRQAWLSLGVFPRWLTASVPRQSGWEQGGVRPGAHCDQALAWWGKCDFTPRPAARHSCPSRVRGHFGLAGHGASPQTPSPPPFPTMVALESGLDHTSRPNHQVSSHLVPEGGWRGRGKRTGLRADKSAPSPSLTS